MKESWNDQQRKCLEGTISQYWPALKQARVDALIEDLEGYDLESVLDSLKERYKSMETTKFPGHKAILAALQDRLGKLPGDISSRSGLLAGLKEIARKRAVFQSPETGIEYEVMDVGLYLSHEAAKNHSDGLKFQGVQLYRDMSEDLLGKILAQARIPTPKAQFAEEEVKGNAQEVPF